MTELLVSYLVFNGVSYTYTAMYIMNTVIFYSEVQHKLGYIWLTKCPTKREVKHTLKYLNTTSEVIGNSYSIYKTGSIIKPEKEKNEYNKKEKAKIKNSKKKISQSNNIQMGKRYKYLCSLYDLMVIASGEKRERKREKMKQKLDRHRAKVEDKLDKKDEDLMMTYGYHRCQSCKYYKSPNNQLELIASASLKVANESKKFTPDEINELPKLIMNSGKRKPVEKEHLEKFKLVLNKVSVKCANCESVFSNTTCGECGGAAMFCIDSVIELQKSSIAL